MKKYRQNADWCESDHPRDGDGKFTDKQAKFDKQQAEKDKIASKFEEKDDKAGVHRQKMSPAEKIASVKIDFWKDNILPELNDGDLVKIGVATNKPVLLKKSIIDRNAHEHPDLTQKDFETIIAQALYAPSEIFRANEKKPYYHFAKVIEVNSKGKPEIGLALLDVDDSKDYFEVVHAHFVSSSGYQRALNKTNKKD